MPNQVDQATISAVMRELGRRGGAASRSNLTDHEKTRIAKKAAKARWDEYYRLHPEKLHAKKRAKKRSPAR